MLNNSESGAVENTLGVVTLYKYSLVMNSIVDNVTSEETIDAVAASIVKLSNVPVTDPSVGNLDDTATMLPTVDM